MKTFPLDLDVTLHVIVAGPNATMNEGLAQVLRDPDSVVVETAAKPRHAFLMAEWQRPDAVILDMDMDKDALAQTIALLRKITPPLEIIVLGHNTPRLLQSSCLEMDANEVYDKTTDLDELFSALQTVRSLKSELLRSKRRLIHQGGQPDWDAKKWAEIEAQVSECAGEQ